MLTWDGARPRCAQLRSAHSVSHQMAWLEYRPKCWMLQLKQQQQVHFYSKRRSTHVSCTGQQLRLVSAFIRKPFSPLKAYFYCVLYQVLRSKLNNSLQFWISYEIQKVTKTKCDTEKLWVIAFSDIWPGRRMLNPIIRPTCFYFTNSKQHRTKSSAFIPLINLLRNSQPSLVARSSLLRSSQQICMQRSQSRCYETRGPNLHQQFWLLTKNAAVSFFQKFGYDKCCQTDCV